MRSPFECRNKFDQSLSTYEDYRYHIVSIASDQKPGKSGVYSVFGVVIIIVTGDDIVRDW